MGLLTVAGVRAQSAATVNIQANQPGAVVSSNLFGIFFEEINFAGEGGAYAEMVRNRAFYTSTNANFWSFVTTGTATGLMSVDSTQPLNTNIVNSLKLTMSSGTGSVGAGNAGFWGMTFQTGATYNLNFFAMASNGFTGTITAQLESANGSTVYAQTNFGGLTTNWQRFSASLVASSTDTNAQLVLSISNSGTIWLDVVSLFPQATFFNRTNGLRSDLGGMLSSLHPSFLRFPGGNYIEANNLTNSVRWKKSIGDISQRPGHMNDAWGYWSTDGFGFHEFLQFCEDMGMEPLYDISAGLALGYNGSTNNTVPINQMGPWVQDAVDLISYANDPTNTTWGAQRATNGHPAPFNLKYLEIGNENGGSYLDARYTLFYDAIKAQYPNIHLIAAGGNWSGGPPASRPVEIMDEHYYSSASTFISYATKYDSYSRSGSKVFVGEYAVTASPYNNLTSALGEAAFMTGMERNSDIVLLASYAPLFANVNSVQWQPDMIYYDSARSLFGTPSYYVQKLFGQNRGDSVLPATVVITTNSSSSAVHGTIGLGSWNTSVQYTNIVVTSNVATLYQSDFVNQGTNGWSVFNGTWSTSSGTYQQTAQITDCYSTYLANSSTNWANYTITLQARKTGGAEGFLVMFNVLDNNNWTWWNIGGWSDTLDAIEQMVGGSKTTYAQVSQTIALNTWYYIRIVVTGSRAQCYLGTNAVQAATNLVQDVTVPSTTGGLLVSSTYAKAAGQVVVKAVNPYGVAMPTTFNLTGVNAIAPNATLIQLASGSPTDGNSLSSPTYVFPVTNTITGSSTNFTVTLPANSLSVLRLTTSGINNYTNLLLQIPSVITNGVTVPSTVWAQQAGSWFNLTTNANHAITWSSANTNVAVVDINGNVTGVGSGTTTITASYASLGLIAAQPVQVNYVWPALAHRYSFSETSGTTTADSIGGSAWNGTLPRGGTFSGGQLTLASNLQQYVQLPAGILSNYTAVTIDAWASFGPLPSACFFFGFGNIIGSSGEQYIFAQPLNGRIAITATNYAGEQNTSPNPSGSWAGQTNLHITAVFNPPLGYLALYTNGVLAAINTAVTIPFTSVNNLYSYIGRSLYSGDSYFTVSLDEFRIYNGALSAADIAASQVLGSGALLSTSSPTVNAVSVAGNLTLVWPVAASGFSVLMSTNLTVGNWTSVAVVPQLIGSQWQVSLPLIGSAQYFRLQK